MSTNQTGVEKPKEPFSHLRPRPDGYYGNDAGGFGKIPLRPPALDERKGRANPLVDE